MTKCKFCVTQRINNFTLCNKNNKNNYKMSKQKKFKMKKERFLLYN